MKCKLFKLVVALFITTELTPSYVLAEANKELSLCFDKKTSASLNLKKDSVLQLDGVSPVCQQSTKFDYLFRFKNKEGENVQAKVDDAALKNIRVGDEITLKSFEFGHDCITAQANVSSTKLGNKYEDETKIQSGENVRYVAFVVASYNGEGPSISDERIRDIFFRKSNSTSKFFESQGDSQSRIKLIGRYNEDGDVFRVGFSSDIQGGRTCTDAFSDIWDQAVWDSGLGSLTNLYDHIVVIRKNSGVCENSGQAEFNSYRSVLYVTNSWSDYDYSNTLAHELGHNLLLDHAGSLVCPSGGADCRPQGDFLSLRKCSGNSDSGPCRRTYENHETMGIIYDNFAGSRQEKLSSKGSKRVDFTTSGNYLLDDLNSNLDDRRYLSLNFSGDEYHVEYRGENGWSSNDRTKNQLLISRYFPSDLYGGLPRSALLKVAPYGNRFGLKEEESFYFSEHRILIDFKGRHEENSALARIVNFNEFDDSCREKPSISMTPSYQESSIGVPPTFHVTVKNNNPYHCGAADFKLKLSLAAGGLPESYINQSVKLGATMSKTLEIIVPPSDLWSAFSQGSMVLSLSAVSEIDYEFAEPGKFTSAKTEQAEVNFSSCGSAPSIEIKPEMLSGAAGSKVEFELSFSDPNSIEHCNFGNPLVVKDNLPYGWAENIPGLWIMPGSVIKWPLKVSIPEGTHSGEIPFSVEAESLLSEFRSTGSAFLGINGLGNDKLCDRPPLVIVTPGLQEGAPGAELPYRIEVRNLNPWYCGVIPYFLSDIRAQEFEGRFKDILLEVASGSSASTIYNIKSSEDSDPGVYEFSIKASDNEGSAGEYAAYYEISGDECNKAPGLKIEPSEKEGRPGLEVHYSLHVQNRNGKHCGTTQYSTLTNVAQGWTVESNPQVFLLSAGGLKIIDLAITSSSTALPGEYNFDGIVRYQQSNNHLLRGERGFKGTYIINDLEENDECNEPIQLELSPNLQTGGPGITKSYKLVLKNPNPDSCDIERLALFARVTPPLGRWNLSISENGLLLGPGEIKYLDLSVTPPYKDVVAGDYLVIVESLDNEGDSIFAQAIYRVEESKKNKSIDQIAFGDLHEFGKGGASK